MVGDPRDRTAYAIAFATLGLALTALIAGVCWLAVQHGTGTDIFAQQCALRSLAHCRPEVSIHHETDTPYVPGGLWIVLAALGGILVGALIPLPAWLAEARLPPSSPIRRWLPAALIAAAVLLVAAAAIPGYSRDILLSMGGLGAALAGVLLGLLVPSPGRAE
jgi:hypothetical protein